MSVGAAWTYQYDLVDLGIQHIIPMVRITEPVEDCSFKTKTYFS